MARNKQKKKLENIDKILNQIEIYSKMEETFN